MFCVKCGKQIDEVSFCPYCGQPVSSTPVQNNITQVYYVHKPLSEKLKEFGYGKLISLVSVVLAVVGIFIRSENNEIETVRYGLAFEDYYVISEDGQSKIMTALIIHIILTGILICLGKKSKARIPVVAVLLAVAAIGVLIAAMTMRTSAPY